MGESLKLQNFGLEASTPTVADDIDVEEQLDNVVLTRLTKIVGHVDVHQNVSHIRKQISDAEKLLGHTSSLLTCLKQSMQFKRINPADFVMGILRGFDTNIIKFGIKEKEHGAQNKMPNICWTALGEKGMQIFREVHCGCCTLIGPLEIKVKPRQRKSKYACKDLMLEKSQPLVLISDDVIKDDSMEIKVGSLYGKLLENKLLVLDNLLFEESSFSQAVENLFALSFLVKDGSVGLTISENGEHLIVPKIAPTTEDRSRGVHDTQFAFRIDYSEWKMQRLQQERRDPANTRLLLDLNSEPKNDFQDMKDNI